MYSVMVVDDEQFFRSSFINTVNWEALNCRVVAQADNGLAAIQQLMQTNIDIVFTDMAMPAMDGVSLIEYISKSLPLTQCVVLSNFDTFDYVKKSMQHGAVDYLLKHKVNQQAIEKVLHSIITNIELRKSQGSYGSTDDTIDYILPAFKQNCLKMLLEGSVADKAKAKDMLKRMWPQINIASILVAAFKIDSYYPNVTSLTQEKQALFRSTFINLSQQAIERVEVGYITHMSEDTFAFIFSSAQTNSTLYLTSRLNTCIESLHNIHRQFFNITCSYGISNVCVEYERLPQYYKQALDNMQESFMLGKESIVQWKSKKSTEQRLITLDVEQEKQIYTAVTNGDFLLTEKLIKNSFFLGGQGGLSKDNIQSLAIELVNLSMRICKNKNISINFLYESTSNPHKHLLKISTAQDVELYLIEKFEKLCNAFSTKQSSSSLIQRTITYLNTQYGDTALSLGSVADDLGVNSSYLSRTFKSDAGVGFNEYLTKLRIKKACEMICSQNTDLKTVAQECGFSSYNYFFKVFKEQTNLTPQQYKEQNL